MRTASLILAILLAFAVAAEDAPYVTRQIVPEHAPYMHGSLVDVPFIIDGYGVVHTSERHVFLAVKLDTPVPAGSVEYVQDIDYLVSSEGYVLRSGGEVSRSVNTAEADAEGWLVLKLSKPCAPDETLTDVGMVRVCPVRVVGDNRIFACALPSNGISPLYAGVPAEKVRCRPGKRRAARR